MSWAEDFDFAGIDFDKGAFDEVNAIGDCGENGFEAFADGFGFSGEVYD